MNFNELISQGEILKAIDALGFTTATPIQEQAIPLISDGRDLFGCAQTGTGKTAAFLLPTLQRIATQPRLVVKEQKSKGPRALILVPTRELALQVSQESIKLSKFLNRMTTVCIFGGTPYPIQNKQLARPYEILIATPGRLIDHLERGRIDLSQVEIFILDEADRMLELGFIEPVEEISSYLPSTRQTLMFSATASKHVLQLCKKLQNDPVHLSVAQSTDEKLNIEQRLHNVDNLEHKYRLLDHLLSDESLTQAIVFTATKMHAEKILDRLLESGHEAAALHGDMNQRQRTQSILKLRQGKIKIMVATNVAARGIDIKAVSHVINFDLPNCVEDYVHRIGRTGRAGASGIALTFALPKESQQVKRIEQFTGQKMVPHLIAGMEPKIKASIGGDRPSGRPNSRRPFDKQKNKRPFFKNKEFRCRTPQKVS